MTSGGSYSSLPLLARTMRDAMLLIALCIACLIPAIIVGSENEAQCIPTEDNNQCVAPKQTQKAFRMIQEDELAQHNGKTDGGKIWISILGEVYDVTLGADYYGEESSYHVFAGRDATPCFVTGTFTDKGAEKNINQVPAKDLLAIHEWKEFYDEHEKYFKVGLLEGVYYNNEGTPTPTLRNTWRRLEIGRMEAAKIRAERAVIRKKKLEDRKAKKDAEKAKLK